MKKIAFEVDDETAAFISMDAGKLKVSESGYIGRLLQQGLKEAREYREAERRFLAIRPFKVEFIDGRRPTREELYDRKCLR